VKNKSFVVAASFALLLMASVPAAHAGGMDDPWTCSASFIECLVQGVLNVL
jgi:hypothetical protein